VNLLRFRAFSGQGTFSSRKVVGGSLVTMVVVVGALGYYTLRVAPTLQPRGVLVAEQSVGSNPALDSCQLKDISSTPNGDGLVAITREVNCPGDLAQGSGYFAVFVHKIGAASTKENLVFEYEPGFAGNIMSGPPIVSWKSHALLTIKETGIIAELDTMSHKVGSINISYFLGPIQADDR
jgi:hypothetical protein